MDRPLVTALRSRYFAALFLAAVGCGDQAEPMNPPETGGSGGTSGGAGGVGGKSSGGAAGSGGATTDGGPTDGAGGAAGGKGGSGGATGGSGGTAGSGAGGSTGGTGGTGGGSGGGSMDAGPRADAPADTSPPCSGDACICMPGERRECYSGPANTKGIGVCVAGSQTCDASGTAWGACAGEVVPRTEDCASAQDEDCDGRTDCFIVDLRADVNRNGTIDLTDATEDTGEDAWDGAHGAVFLPNIDDDANTCSKTAADTEIAKCNDAADEVTNGADDLLDLARLKTVPAPALPADATGTLTVDAKAVDRVRIFKKGANGTFTVLRATDVITATELKEGVEFGIEGKDVQRDTAWNGYADVTLTVKSGGDAGSSVSDTVRLRQAPLIFRHHLSPVVNLYAIDTAGTGYQPFITSLQTAVTAAGSATLKKLPLAGDQWTQDIMEPAYVAMPGAAGATQVIRVNVRSANYGGSKGSGLRPAGRVVFTTLRGKDVGGVQQYDANHANNMDSLNSTGNFETIPPYKNGNENYPVGRVLRGRTATWFPDKMMDGMVDAQGQQTILAIDTSWLVVGHVDETISFMKASTPHGFIMLVLDPAGAVKMLQDASTAGNGSVAMFAGTSGATTISAVLSNTALMTHNQDAAADVAAQIAVIKAATGLTDDEIVKVPVTHRLTSSKSVAHIPGTVNGIAMSDKVFFAPEPHGPVIGGKDIFKAAFEASMTKWGITVYWVEDWDLFHALSGEIHCATNADRAVGPGETWWTSGK
jgi:protein-arginine deiminase